MGLIFIVLRYSRSVDGELSNMGWKGSSIRPRSMVEVVDVWRSRFPFASSIFVAAASDVVFPFLADKHNHMWLPRLSSFQSDASLAVEYVRNRGEKKNISALKIEINIPRVHA
jgi:hypothetical protein